MSVKVILWDIDGTVLNFEESERAAIRKGFWEFRIGECTDEMLQDYSRINTKYWKALERGEITKERVLNGRFEEFFEKHGINTLIAPEFNIRYQRNLSDVICFNDNAFELIKSLQGDVKQYAVTNGTSLAQTRKLKRSGLDELLDGVFISDNIGYEKPAKEFFDAVFQEIGAYDNSEIMVVGDSLTSDIKGGNQAGILCCWYNPKKVKNELGVRVDHEITSLQQIYKIIG